MEVEAEKKKGQEKKRKNQRSATKKKVDCGAMLVN
jgi:hypothetical protein